MRSKLNNFEALYRRELESTKGVRVGQGSDHVSGPPVVKQTDSTENITFAIPLVDGKHPGIVD